MNDQIKLVILKTDADETQPAVQYIVEPRIIKRMTAGKSDSLVMEESHAETLLEDMAKLVEEIQIPDSPPYQSTVVMNDGRRLSAPKDALTQMVLKAWSDTSQYQQMLKDSFEGGQMMGAVACPTDTLQQLQDAANSSMGGMGSFADMGMNTALQHPAIQEPMQPQQTRQSVRIDNQTWNCRCGETGLSAKFCPECGNPAPPLLPAVWNCPNCGTCDLTGRFCPQCGTPMPAQG